MLQDPGYSRPRSETLERSGRRDREIEQERVGRIALFVAK